MSEEYRGFDRQFSDEMLEKLKADPLFKNYLLPDITCLPAVKHAAINRVFPAIREGRIDFYHRGGKLFSFGRRGFTTHMKYAASFKKDAKKSTEITQEELRDLELIRDFESGYPDIKALCKLYAEREACGVSEIYGLFSFVTASPFFVVLDIEASFDARLRPEAENDQDRIDLVLFDVAAKSLLFVEAKRFGNSDIRASSGNTPAVVAQIVRYRDQIVGQEKHILSAYAQYVAAMNDLFDLKLPPPETIVPEIPLLIFEYDDAHERGPLKVRKKVIEDAKVCCLTIGKPSDLHFERGVATLASWFKKARAWKR